MRAQDANVFCIAFQVSKAVFCLVAFNYPFSKQAKKEERHFKNIDAEDQQEPKYAELLAYP